MVICNSDQFYMDAEHMRRAGVESAAIGTASPAAEASSLVAFGVTPGRPGVLPDRILR